jgi:hypothetical protein
MEQLGVFQQRFTRNAAPVEAYTAKPVAFHNASAKTKLRRPDCGRVTARTATYDHKIKCLFCHERQFLNNKKGNRIPSHAQNFLANCNGVFPYARLRRRGPSNPIFKTSPVEKRGILKGYDGSLPDLPLIEEEWGKRYSKSD